MIMAAVATTKAAATAAAKPAALYFDNQKESLTKDMKGESVFFSQN